MKVTVIGTGYVGLVSGACFAEKGADVVCVDIDENKVNNLKKGIIPIYEPGLEEIVKKNIARGMLSFSTNIKEGVQHGKIIFSAVGTPPDKDHKADLSAVKAVAKSFGEVIEEPKIFVNKSTVPVGTAKICEEIINQEIAKREKNIEFRVVSNPEFLREGVAVSDTLYPERIIVGTEDEQIKAIMKKFYAPFVSEERPLIFTSVKSAEIIKYASNSFLATKISFINEVANFCEKSGGNIDQVAYGMGFDSRIGKKYLQAGIGYGGSCLPKDVKALLMTGKKHDYDFKILSAVEQVNKEQKLKPYQIAKKEFGDLKGKNIAILGLAFKPDTDDMREAPAIDVVNALVADGALVRVFDPIAQENAKKDLPQKIVFTKNIKEAVENADAVLFLTEWGDFYNLDLVELKNILKGDIIIDGRNIFNPEEVKKIGFKYFSIGR